MKRELSRRLADAPLIAFLPSLIFNGVASAADSTISLQATLPPTKTSLEPWVELAKVMAWPVAVVLLALWLRQPLADFTSAIAGRVSKLSFAQISIELETAKEPARTPLLDEIRDTTSSAPIGESSRALMQQAGSTTPADFAVISLGNGDEWLTSRLFIAAAMMERMRGIKVFVFVDSTSDSHRHFLGVVSVRRLRWLLAQRYPWLEIAYVQAQAQIYPFAHDPRQLTFPLIFTDNGAMEPNVSQNVLQSYISKLQTNDNALIGNAGSEWVLLERGVHERAEWVTRRLVAEILTSGEQNSFVIDRQEGGAVALSKASLRHEADFVAVVDERGQFVKLLDRRTYLENITKRVLSQGEAVA